MEPRHSILIVDDEAGPREALNMILKPFYGVYNAENGNQALDMIGKTPVDLVILDLKMPGLQGTDILREIKHKKSSVEVVILSGYGSLKTAIDAIRLGAADYLLKPFNVTEIISVINRILAKKTQRDQLANFLTELGEMVGCNATVDEIRGSMTDQPAFLEKLKEMFSRMVTQGGPIDSGNYLEFVRVLSETLENKDPFTHGHSSRVNYYSNLLAQRLNLSEAEQRDLQIGAYLHDIGKLGVDVRTIYKEGSFTRQELLLMRRHPEIGVDLVTPIGLSHHVVSIIRHHHEFYDGTGYPDGLKGETIPLLTRIVSTSESFDAMVTDRPYRKALPVKEIVAELKRCSGKQFDPYLVQLLLEIIEEKGDDILPKRFQPVQPLTA
ncbi:MAG: response regulator [Nitrospirae bacterium]|nr:response regulator [Nitrospirota bacterium]